METLEILKQAMECGDSRCSISIGTLVEKSAGEPGDITPQGTKGKVLGSVLVENKECYLVEFESFPAPTFIIKDKLKLI